MKNMSISVDALLSHKWDDAHFKDEENKSKQQKNNESKKNSQHWKLDDTFHHCFCGGLDHMSLDCPLKAKTPKKVSAHKENEEKKSEKRRSALDTRLRVKVRRK